MNATTTTLRIDKLTNSKTGEVRYAIVAGNGAATGIVKHYKSKKLADKYLASLLESPNKVKMAEYWAGSITGSISYRYLTGAYTTVTV